MKDLVIFGALLTPIGFVLVLCWSIQNKFLTIYVNWTALIDKLYENFAFGIFITGLIVWLQIIVVWLVAKHLKDKK